MPDSRPGAVAHDAGSGVDAPMKLTRTRFTDGAWADLRYALRALGRTPSFTISAVLVLSLGIGASAAIFSAVNAVLVSSLPYPNDDRLVRVYNANSATARWSLSVVDYQALRDQTRTLSAVGALVDRDVPVAAGGLEPAQMRITPTTAGFFEALGVRAARGRVLLSADERETSPRVAVLSDAFAVRAFGSAAGVLGKTVQIDGAATTVVGVLPPGVHDLAGIHSEIWPNYQPATPTRRGPFGIALIARLRDGVPLEQSATDLAAISKRIFPLWSAGFRDRTAYLAPVPLREAIVGKDAPTMLAMFGAAAVLLLLTAIANVASLMLARTAARAREISLRAVLGASSARLARLVVTEATVLSTLGAVLGVIAAKGILRVLIVIAPDMPRLDAAVVDWRVLVYAGGAALLVGLAVGLHPVLTLFRGGGSDLLGLRSGQRDMGQSYGATRLRGVLVSAEFALAVPLLAGAGLLIQSIDNLQRVDPGFDPSHIAYAVIALPRATYPDQPRVQSYWRRAADAVGQLPGVVAAGYSTELPPSGLGNTNNFNLPTHPPPPSGQESVSPWMAVSAGYFGAVGARLVAGRMFAPVDTGPVQSLIVSESWVRHYTPDVPAVGQRIFEGGCTAATCAPTYIVGVVSDVKYDGLSGTSDAAYTPATEGMGRWGYLVVRTSRDPVRLLGELRTAMRRVDPSVPVDDVGDMANRVYESTAQPRHWALLLAAFATSALLLAAIGIFGLLSYLVTTMRREIGVRVALGAQRARIAALIVKRGLVNSLIGAAIGLALAMAGRRLIAGSLFGVTPSDPKTLAGVTALLVLVALLACWIPAHAAASVHPTEAIRGE